MRLVLSLLLLLFLLPVPHESKGQGAPHISKPELVKVLQTEDTNAIVKALNLAKRSQESTELMSFLLNLWNARDGTPNLPWNVIESPRIKIEIANVLIQASNNGLIKFNSREARAYSRQIAIGSEEDAKTTAILNLGLLGDPKDIELLKEIALGEESRTFRSAVIALAKMCGPRADEALAEIRTRARRGDNREFASTPVEELAPFKQCPRSQGS